MGSPATRLDRLVSLLDIGSSPAIRSTAATQLGQMAALRVRGASTTQEGSAPDPAEGYRGTDGEWNEALMLVARVVPLLLSKSWDTRSAAAQALYQICRAAGVWDPDGPGAPPLPAPEAPAPAPEAPDTLGLPPGERLTLASFSLPTVLASGTKLLASAGREYDVPELLSRERLQSAKKDVLGKLGLAFGGADVDMGLDMDAELGAPAERKPSIKAEPEPEPEEPSRPLSARERNQLKRKRKLEAKSQSRAPVHVEPEKRAKLEGERAPTQAAAALSLQVPRGVWPFRALAELLSVELVSPTWEARHGAALGLRELFRTQGAGGGKTCGASPHDNARAHDAWCEDLAVRLLCVFALDRLGDFVFDHVVAPVRETASQTLAQLLPHMSSELVRSTHHVLLEMVRQDQVRAAGLVGQPGQRTYVWEVRHAGLLGIKYEVAMRVDVLGVEDDMLADVLDVAQLGLRDDDDDVRAVAAATLLPITRNLVAHQLARMPALLDQLWACVGDRRDDLSSSAASVMDLLAALMAQPDVVRTADSSLLVERVPSLFRFVRHTITHVRLAMLHALHALLQAPSLPRAWLDERLVRLLFQNLLVEERAAIREATSQVWALALGALGEQLGACVAPHIPALFQLVLTPIGTPMDTALFFTPPRAHSEHDIDRGILTQDLTLVGVDVVIRGRLEAASALGELVAQALPSQDAACARLCEGLHSASALQTCLCAVVAQRWAEQVDDPPSFLGTHAQAAQMHGVLLGLLDASMPPVYAEMRVLRQRIHHDCQLLAQAVARAAPGAPMAVPEAASLTMDHVRALLDGARAADAPAVHDLQRKLSLAVERYETTKETEDVLVLAAVAGAVVAWGQLPPKLNPLIRSLMNSIKYEENLDLQQRAAQALARFLVLCTRSDAPANPSGKVVKNLCAFVCQDTAHTPLFAEKKHANEGICVLDTRAAGAREERMTPGQLIRRGAQAALQQICAQFGAQTWERVPMLWERAAQPLLDLPGHGAWSDEQGQAVLDVCAVLESVAPHVDAALHASFVPLLDALVRVAQSEYAVVRAAAARCFSVLATCLVDEAMHRLVEDVVPLLGDADLHRRQGAMEVVSCTVRTPDERVLPYVLFLVVPVLGRMSDPHESVRLLASNTFAELVKLVPLIHGLPDPPHFSPALLARRETEKAFLTQLLDGSQVQPYTPPVEMKVQLRPYQLEGVSWMTFLARYQLHGILCDDMGLGKTLQSITLLSCQHWERAQRWAATHAPDARPIPSLIVCPPTLTGHWVHEIQQYSPNLRPLLYVGHPSERARLVAQIDQCDAVVMSYDVVRNDIHVLAPRAWHYCLLDEGHVICSAKTKTTRAVKQIRAQHRLILSGTPIQNNVLELWSLFDFLMPGFLGSDQSFHERFARPVLACRSGKPSAAEKEAATLALEALHKQIVPFLLRRLKEDVLNDLPPKIIQDVECELSDVQKTLYDEFVQSKARRDVEEALAGGDEPDADPAQQHVFQTLQYLRKLANHPSLVLDPKVPAQKKLLDQVQAQRGTLAGLGHAPKLQALRQLLLDCGIGKEAPTNDAALVGADTGASVSQHRVLVFCQMKQMLDVIEKELFQTLMPSVTYLRLDGSVSSDKRHGIVQTFNADPSIDVLLLTTSVGGLGLTLTGADTVIFVEHDWNPMKDLQAMDRAHRLGQKKVVNVYRLITRNTLEAKIMGLQQFKLNIANSVVTQQNKSMEHMDTDRILDLFGPAPVPAATEAKPTRGISQKALLASLEHMPDTDDHEYADMTQWRPSAT
ncbi:TATA-binding protein-associated factor mot1 [Malassezia caprae]|uniref:TATA-binding protein-associated factor mot1 n=1 Tax=Malassezia caprae TaxID=1381934 RepID=A0AAF0IWX3_9BASI|nr:TATA-binding protein-associated factor mot1 [Malassezia caprae]